MRTLKCQPCCWDLGTVPPATSSKGVGDLGTAMQGAKVDLGVLVDLESCRVPTDRSVEIL